MSYMVVFRGKSWGTFNLKRDAEQRERDVKTEAQRMGRIRRVKRSSMAELLDRYFETVEGKGLKETTLRTYRRYLRHLVDYVGGDVPVTAVDVEQLERFVAYLKRDRKMNGYTIAQVMILVRALFDAARRWSYIAENPATDVGNLPRAKHDKEVFALSVQQHKALVNAVRPEYKIMLDVWPRLACRPSEMYGLQVGDFDATEGTLSVERQLLPGGKGYGPLKWDSKPRTLHLDSWTVDQLQRQVAGLRDQASVAPLFPSVRGMRITHPVFSKRVFRPAVTGAGLPMATTPHICRHTGATWLLESGTSLAYVSKHLGHGDPAITARTYLHLLDDVDRSAMRRMDEWYRGMERIVLPKAARWTEQPEQPLPSEEELAEIEREAAEFMQRFREEHAQEIARASILKEYRHVERLLEQLEENFDREDVIAIRALADAQVAAEGGTGLEHSVGDMGL